MSYYFLRKPIMLEVGIGLVNATGLALPMNANRYSGVILRACSFVADDSFKRGRPRYAQLSADTQGPFITLGWPPSFAQQAPSSGNDFFNISFSSVETKIGAIMTLLTLPPNLTGRDQAVIVTAIFPFRRRG